MTDVRAPQTLRTTSRVSKRPAFIVLGIVFVIITGGALLALIPKHSPPTSNFAQSSDSKFGHELLSKGATVDGVRMVSAASFLTPIESNYQIPSDVIAALIVPRGSVGIGIVNRDKGSGSFDRQINLRVDEASILLLHAYQSALPRLGWHIDSTSATTAPNGRHGTEILAQIPSSDGYYWEVGVTVLTESVPHLSTTQRSQLVASSDIQTRILQVPDGT